MSNDQNAKIEIINSQDFIILDLESIQLLSKKAHTFCLQESKIGSPLRSLQSLEVSILNDKQIALVHEEFMNDSTPTDVITFDYGEILVSAETALAQSKALKVSLEDEILLYIIHGMLHLGGYLDKDEADFNEMKIIQERILNSCLD